MPNIGRDTCRALEALIERLEKTTPLTEAQCRALAAKEIDDAVNGSIAVMETGFPSGLHANSDVEFREKVPKPIAIWRRRSFLPHMALMHILELA